MNLQRVEYFLAVVEHGTVTAAAAALHIAQPALSRQLKSLQAELRVQLFAPHGAGLALTPAGRAFVPHARDLLAAAQRTRRFARSLETGAVGTLTIAATMASVRGFVSAFVAASAPTDPIMLVETARHFELAAMLEERTDLIITPVIPAPHLQSLEIVRVPIWAHVAVDHPWVGRSAADVGSGAVPTAGSDVGSGAGPTAEAPALSRMSRSAGMHLPVGPAVDIAELAACDVFLHSQASVSRALFDAAATQAGVGIEAFFESDDGTCIQALAAAGHGIGVTSEFGAFDTVALPIMTPGRSGSPERLEMSLYGAWRADHFAASAIAEIVQRLHDFMRTRPPLAVIDD